MSAGTRGGHLAVYTSDGDAQQTLERLGAAGVFEPGENPLAVVWQDASANRAGYFAEHAVGTKVTLGADGSARARTTVTMRNEAPDGPPSELLGDGRGEPVGSWGADVEVYLPVGAIDPQVSVSGPSVFDVDEALGHPVADAYLYADPGGRSAATVTYRLDAAATEADGIWTYRTQVMPRPMLRPVPYSAGDLAPRGSPRRARLRRRRGAGEHRAMGRLAGRADGPGRELRALTGQRPCRPLRAGVAVR